jgi:predicted amidophosphoribosyltransferase
MTGRCPQCGEKLGRFPQMCDECADHPQHYRFESRCAHCRAERVTALVRALRIVAYRLIRGRK